MFGWCFHQYDTGTEKRKRPQKKETTKQREEEAQIRRKVGHYDYDQYDYDQFHNQQEQAYPRRDPADAPLKTVAMDT